MHCTNCGAEVAPGAKFCGNCGTPANLSASQAQPTAKAGASNKATTGCGAAAAIIVLILVVAMCSGKTDQQKQAEQASRPTMSVTADELWQAYQANEAAAQQAYGNVNLTVTGTVSGVDLDIADNPVVLLKTSNEFESVHADLTDVSKPNAAQLVKGQSIVLHCSGVSEIIGTPILKDCDF